MAESQPEPCLSEEDSQRDILSTEVSVSRDDAYSEGRQRHMCDKTWVASSGGGSGDDEGGSSAVHHGRESLEEDQNGTLWEQKDVEGEGEKTTDEEEAKGREEEEEEENERRDEKVQRKEEEEERGNEDIKDKEEEQREHEERHEEEEEREGEQTRGTERVEENAEEGEEEERREEKMQEVKTKDEDRDNAEKKKKDNDEEAEETKKREEKESKERQQVTTKEEDVDREENAGEDREEEVKTEEEEEERRQEEEERREEEEDTSDTTGDEEEEVDPRVAENLEILNQSCAEVNRLENELDEARSKYRSTFQASSQRMEELGSKIKKSIQRARQYFELVGKAKQAQSEALRAARQFQSANGNYRAAMEMVTLAEKGLQDEVTANKTKTLNSAWQETLSHAVQRLTEAEREKSSSEAEHNKKAAACAQLEAQIHVLEKKYKRSIAKARPYFETKAELELKLQQQKQNVWDLQSAISTRKTRYSEALRCLEAVSTEIHENRRARKRMLLQYPREPGVGAETDSVGSSISDNNTIERGVFSTSSSFYPEEDEEGEESDSESAGDVFSAYGGSSSDLRKQTLVRSASRRSVTTKPQRQGKGHDEQEEDEGVVVGETLEDSASVYSSQVSGRSDFSRSVSGASVFSSEGELSSSLPDSPTSTIPTVANPHSFSGEERALSPKAPAPSTSLMDIACGDVGEGTRQPPCVGQDSSSSSSSECRRDEGLGEKDVDGIMAAPTPQEDSSSRKTKSQQSSEFPAERGIGDGSAQEDTLKENSTTKQAVTVSSRSSSVPSSPSLQQSKFKSQSAKAAAGAKGVKGAPTSVMTISGAVSSQAAMGEVKKTPLRRTDVNQHRPLQGVMLLNPLDLAASSMGGGGPSF